MTVFHLFVILLYIVVLTLAIIHKVKKSAQNEPPNELVDIFLLLHYLAIGAFILYIVIVGISIVFSYASEWKFWNYKVFNL